MSSSQPFASSPISPTKGQRRKSKFTFKHFAQLGLFSTACPLRVIAHVDLDAFYAQCEGVRLGIPEDQPLAVQVKLSFLNDGQDPLMFRAAMARLDRDQLPGKETWSEQAHHHH